MTDPEKKPQNQSRLHFRASYFYKWMVNNKVVTALAVLLLILLNVLLLSNLSFVFAPVVVFINTIILPIVLAAVFFYLLNPVVNFFEKKKIPRTVTIVVIFLILGALIVWGLMVAIPSSIEAIMRFSHHVPHYVNVTQKEVEGLFSNPQFIKFRPQINKISTSVGNSMIDWSKNVSTQVISSLTDIVEKTGEIVISIIIFPFVLFYLLRDGGEVGTYLTNFLPNRWRGNVAAVLSDINKQLSNYVRGQILIAISVTIMLLIGLPIVGLHYALVIAIVAGILNLIPFLGFYLALVPALIVALALGGPLMMVKVLIIFIIEEEVVSRVLQPLVLGAQLKIHPIMIIFILLTAGKLFAVWGVLLGIPIYASIKVVATHFFDWYREVSILYENESKEEVD